MKKTSSEEFEEVVRLCVSNWGVPAQVEMVTEEISEFIEQAAKVIKAIQKLKRAEGTGSWEAFIEEAVDLSLMLGQVKFINEHYDFGKGTAKPDWDFIREEKLLRLKQRLSK